MTLKNEYISEQTLRACLDELYELLQQLGGSLIFFDINSFYAFIDYYLSENENRRVIQLLNIIEPFIPITVSDENIDIFLEAAMRNDVREVLRLEEKFISNSKTRFIQTTIAKDIESWRSIVNACQTIRMYKSEGIFALS